MPAVKVGICHATGSESNPYVYIEVSENAVKAHEDHQHGEDIIGVSSEAECPGATPPSTVPETPPSTVPPTPPASVPEAPVAPPGAPQAPSAPGVPEAGVPTTQAPLELAYTGWDAGDFGLLGTVTVIAGAILTMVSRKLKGSAA